MKIDSLLSLLCSPIYAKEKQGAPGQIGTIEFLVHANRSLSVVYFGAQDQNINLHDSYLILLLLWDMYFEQASSPDW